MNLWVLEKKKVYQIHSELRVGLVILFIGPEIVLSHYEKRNAMKLKPDSKKTSHMFPQSDWSVVMWKQTYIDFDEAIFVAMVRSVLEIFF